MLIISASRRTDIPAFYTDWFMKRVEAGYCTVFNPFNRNNVSYVSLDPINVSIIVFWTKNAKPMFPHLSTLNEMGYKYYFQYTLNGYPPKIERNVPQLKDSVKNFCILSNQISPKKLIWRYDPILISNITSFDYHKIQFSNIASQLKGYTNRVVISIVDVYRKATYNFRKLAKDGVEIKGGILGQEFNQLMKFFVDVAKKNNMDIYSCAETIDLKPHGILPGKCIDDEYIASVFKINVTSQKDKSQRLECGCVQSKDIGAYDTCLHGCAYCYAGTLSTAKKNREKHFIDSPSIIGRYEASKSIETTKTTKGEDVVYKQLRLFD